jgi:ADP-L-glycero-D-manno-heptose 6-epimerase
VHNRDVRLIYASSAATYGDGARASPTPTTRPSLQALRPLNAYGWSKAPSTLRPAGRPTAPGAAAVGGLKFFNVYGPNEHHKGSMKSVAAQIWPQVEPREAVRLLQVAPARSADGGPAARLRLRRVTPRRRALAAGHAGVSGVYNLGSGEARSFADLALAVLTLRAAPAIDYIDMPEAMRGRYQYFTQADLGRLRAAGWQAPMTATGRGRRRLRQPLPVQPDPYR